jgi:hypothetical protein
MIADADRKAVEAIWHEGCELEPDLVGSPDAHATLPEVVALATNCVIIEGRAYRE